MTPNLADLNAFVAVARAHGFREASRTAGASASTLSEAVRRLEASLGVRLLHRTTRSVAPTEAGAASSSGSPRRSAKWRRRSARWTTCATA